MSECNKLAIEEPNYSILAAALLQRDLEDGLPSSFSAAVANMEDLLDSDFVAFVNQHQAELDASIVQIQCSLEAIKKFKKSYLLRDPEGAPLETPSYLFMRVAIGLWCGDLPSVLKTYRALASSWYIHATPTLMNAGTKARTHHDQSHTPSNNNLTSCFLLTMGDDSREIMKAITDAANISRSGGGLGMAIELRRKGMYIAGTGGFSNGALPFLRILDSTLEAFDQGGGKRKGNCTVSFRDFDVGLLDAIFIRDSNRPDRFMPRLFPVVALSDLFMQRVKEKGQWSFFDAPHLHNLFGERFETEYLRLEREGCAARTMSAMALFKLIARAQCSSGSPYVYFIDRANRTNNQVNLERVDSQIQRNTNLCVEISVLNNVERTDSDGNVTVPGEHGCCNVATLVLPAFIKDGVFDFEALGEAAEQLVSNLNQVIDRQAYPTPEAQYANTKRRPLAIGIQGLADLFSILGIRYGSPTSVDVAGRISETIYFRALSRSCDLAQRDGPYETYKGSKVSQGILHHDHYKAKERLNWAPLRERIAKFGVRNSLLCAYPPTRSTSVFTGSSAMFEPHQPFVRILQNDTGETVVVHKLLAKSLRERGLLNDLMIKAIIVSGGIQDIPCIPEDIKAVFPTVYDLNPSETLDVIAEMQKYVDQQMSTNMYYRPNKQAHSTVRKTIRGAWKRGLKSLYYAIPQGKGGVNLLGASIDVGELVDAGYLRSDFRLLKTSREMGVCEMCE